MSGRGDEQVEVALERVLTRGPADVLDLLAGLRKSVGAVIARQEGSLHGFLRARLRKGRLIVVGRSDRGLALYATAGGDPGARADGLPQPEPPLPEPLPPVVSNVAIRTARAVRDGAERGRVLSDLVAHLGFLHARDQMAAFGPPRTAKALLARADRGRLAVFFKSSTADGVRRLLFHEGPWIAGAVVLFFLLRAYVGEVFQIPSESMRPTLEVGDRVVVPKLWQGEIPERWTVVVFRHFSARRNREIAVVKRLVGLGGEDVAIYQGDVFINGVLAVKPDAARRALRLEKGRWRVQEGTFVDWDKGLSHDEVTWSRRLYPLSGAVYYQPENRPPGSSGVALYDGYLRLDAEREVGGAASVTLSRGRVGQDEGAVEWTLEVEDGGTRLVERTPAGVTELRAVPIEPPPGAVTAELAYVDGVVRASFETETGEWHFEVPRPAQYLPLALRVGTRGAARALRIALDQDVHYSHQHEHGVPTPADLEAGRRNPHRIAKGHVFFLGDNTRDSTDSRSSFTGDIPAKDIVGPVRFRIWPPGRLGAPR